MKLSVKLLKRVYFYLFRKQKLREMKDQSNSKGMFHCRRALFFEVGDFRSVLTPDYCLDKSLLFSWEDFGSDLPSPAS